MSYMRGFKALVTTLVTAVGLAQATWAQQQPLPFVDTSAGAIPVSPAISDPFAEGVPLQQAQGSSLRLRRPGSDESKPAGKKPYILNAEKIHVLPEQDEEMSPLQKLNAQQTQLNAQQARMGDFSGGVDAGRIPLHADKFGLSSLQAAPPPAPPFKGKATSRVQLLADYDLELIVDASLSMRRRDCPGGLTRWNWCGMQAEDLSKQIAPFVPRGLTITAFNFNYDVYHDAKPKNIYDLFANPRFHGGTRLAEPLEDRLSEFLNKRRAGSKPLLIAVITDGVPHPAYQPRAVVSALINASRRMNNPNEIRVVFFQIGANSHYGKAFLEHLDYNLVMEGARFDFVSSVDFDQLQRVGLAQALVNSIQDFATRANSR